MPAGSSITKTAFVFPSIICRKRAACQYFQASSNPSLPFCFQHQQTHGTLHSSDIFPSNSNSLTRCDGTKGKGGTACRGTATLAKELTHFKAAKTVAKPHYSLLRLQKTLTSCNLPMNSCSFSVLLGVELSPKVNGFLSTWKSRHGHLCSAGERQHQSPCATGRLNISTEGSELCWVFRSAPQAECKDSS